ncbi:MAG TPA: YgiT-type zinc finger protein [Methylomirabilota bacterium]|nr:YgiT-type zinc finger protein [Methylomirabilota bacterium]
MKKEKSSDNYGERHGCGERMEERRINQGFWIKGKLILLEDIPAGVCTQCGEKVVNAKVGQRIAALVKDKKRVQGGADDKHPSYPVYPRDSLTVQHGP